MTIDRPFRTFGTAAFLLFLFSLGSNFVQRKAFAQDSVNPAFQPDARAALRASEMSESTESPSPRQPSRDDELLRDFLLVYRARTQGNDLRRSRSGFIPSKILAKQSWWKCE